MRRLGRAFAVGYLLGDGNMPLFRRILPAALLLIGRCFCAPALASDLAYEALERAIADCEARIVDLGANRFSFNRLVEKEDGVSFRARFTPSGADDGVWALTDPTQDQAPRKIRRAFAEFSNERDGDRLISLSEPRRYVHSSFQLVDETENHWVFRGPTIDLSGDTEQSRNFMKKARDALVAELIVRKDPIRIASLKLTNTKPIYPVPVAKIHDFYLKYEFDEAWPDGPLVMKTVRQSVSGTAILVKFHMILNVDNIDMAVASIADGDLQEQR